MITYIVTVKQEVCHELVSTIEVDAADPDEARRKAERLIAEGAVVLQERLTTKAKMKDPFIADIEPLVEFEET